MKLSSLFFRITIFSWFVMTPSLFAAGNDSTLQANNHFHLQAVEKATEADAAAAQKVANDPTRPAYHFLPPALWNNDPNGPIFYQGEYHLFYQHNPYGENWGHMHWGHAKSKNLVHWKHLPIALAPSQDLGEEHCFSGCCVIADDGTPTILYTSIGPKTPAGDGAVQWAAISQDGMRTWAKSPHNPILSETVHGNLKVLDWRDPFAWRGEDGWYMVLGGHPQGGRGAAFLYRSSNLLDWNFLNILYESKSEDNEANWECPNFFQLGEKWVLVYSPHDRVMFHTGTFNSDHTFHSEHRALMDCSHDFYAPTTFVDGQGRRIQWGWIRNLKGDGWQGSMTLPRVLTDHGDGDLGIQPAPELKVLRQTHRRYEEVKLISEAKPLENIHRRAQEWIVRFVPSSSDAYGLQIRIGNEKTIPIYFDRKNKTIGIGEETGPFELQDDEKELEFHLFIDKAIAELYVNNRLSCTRVIPELVQAQSAFLEIVSTYGSALCTSVDVWDLASIW